MLEEKFKKLFEKELPFYHGSEKYLPALAKACVSIAKEDAIGFCNWVKTKSPTVYLNGLLKSHKEIPLTLDDWWENHKKGIL